MNGRSARNVMHVLASLPVGGAEEMVLGTIKHLNRAKFRPVVCSLTDKGPIGAELEKLDTEVLALHRMRRKRFDLHAVMDLRRILQERDIHIVHTHLYHGSLYGRVAAKLAGIPCVMATFQNTYPRRKVRHHLMNWLLAKVTHRIIAVSETVKEHLIRYDGVAASKIVVLENAVELERFVRVERREARRRLGIAEDRYLIGVIAKLEVQKGHRYLLDALHLMKPLDPRIDVLFLGRGTQENTLRRRAEELALRDRVIFGGVRRDIPVVLSALDLSILPSLWEGLSVALLEALAMEVPIIATDVGTGSPVIIPNTTGILVPPRNAVALASAIRFALENADAMRSMAKRGRKHVEAHFSLRDHVARLEALYEEVLE